MPPSPSSPPPLPNSPPTTKRAYVQGRQLIVNNKPFLVKGICYSPVPINASVYWDPLGDYFTEEYSYIWLRDLPLMKAMGANVVRIYGWDSDKDHTPFLDAVEANGLYLMTTFFMGEAVETPVSTPTQRANVIKRFQKAVKQYRHHPALLIWSIGNEINGVWNGFLQQLSNSEVDPCGWDETYDDLGGCWTHLGIKPIYNSVCYNTSLCVYKRLYGFLNDCAVAAHEVADVIVTSTFADVDALYDKVERMGQFAPDLDAWAAQVYRGASFGDFFTGISNSTGKPLLLTEHARTPQDRRPPAVAPRHTRGPAPARPPAIPHACTLAEGGPRPGPLASRGEGRPRRPDARHLGPGGTLLPRPPRRCSPRPSLATQVRRGRVPRRVRQGPERQVAVLQHARRRLGLFHRRGGAGRVRRQPDPRDLLAPLGPAQLHEHRRGRHAVRVRGRLPHVVGGRVLEGLQGAGGLQAGLPGPRLLDHHLRRQGARPPRTTMRPPRPQRL